MPAQMTSTAWGRGLKNMLICGTLAFALACIGGAVISPIFHQRFLDSVWIAGAVVSGAAWLTFVGIWLHGRIVAGAVLLDCGPTRFWWLFLMEGIAGLVTGSSSAGGLPASTTTAIGHLAEISFGVFCLIAASGRLQVRENGIWGYVSLLRWGKIRSYRWASDSALLVRATGPFSWYEWAFSIPPEYKQAIEELLVIRCRTHAVS